MALLMNPKGEYVHTQTIGYASTLNLSSYLEKTDVSKRFQLRYSVLFTSFDIFERITTVLELLYISMKKETQSNGVNGVLNRHDTMVYFGE